MTSHNLTIGAEVAQPPYTNWVRGTPAHDSWRVAWEAAIIEAIGYHDAWALWCMRPDGDIEIRDVLTEGAVWEATDYGTVRVVVLGGEGKTPVRTVGRVCRCGFQLPDDHPPAVIEDGAEPGRFAVIENLWLCAPCARRERLEK